MRVLATALSVALAALPARAADAKPVSGSGGMVVSAHHLASDIGTDVLRHGGNAVDAAVAVGYALAVVYPQAGNLGGGGFMTLRLADGRTTFLDFREKAPMAATATMFQDGNGNVVPGRSTDSWLAVGVPGTVMGLETARIRYGTMPRAALITPAIALARHGFVLGPGEAEAFASEAAALGRDPAARAIFLPAGSPPASGDRLVQADLAATLDAVAALGPDAVYHGPVGAAIVAASHASGGVLAAEDFARYKVRELRPVECDYRGYHVISAPPPSSGGTALCEALQILQGYNLAAMGFHSAAEVHVLAEALRRVYVDRNTKLGDPDFVINPVAHLIDPAYAARLRHGIDPVRATRSTDLGPAVPSHEGHNTTQYDVLDKAGNAVSVTYTLNDWFGAHRVAGRTGIVMNNEMDDFTAKPGHPNMFGLVEGANNAVAPSKTPLSSMAPTIVTKDGQVVLLIGSPGGARIITIVLEAIVNMVDHGMDVAAAIDAPRLHEQWQPDIVYLEPGALAPNQRKILESRGYKFAEEVPWGIAEGIVTRAPILGALGYASQHGMNGPGASGTMFGGHDRREGSGSVTAVNSLPERPLNRRQARSMRPIQ